MLSLGYSLSKLLVCSIFKHEIISEKVWLNRQEEAIRVHTAPEEKDMKNLVPVWDRSLV